MSEVQNLKPGDTPNQDGKKNSGSRESNREHSAEKIDMREHFMGKLSKEADPFSKEPDKGEPNANKIKEDEQSPGNQDESDEGANNQAETGGEESDKYAIEFVDDDNNIVGYADADGNEYNVDGTPFVSKSQEEIDKKSEEPGSNENAGALFVDDRQYTPDDVREVVTERNKLRDQNKEYDADYRRKTTVMSKLRDEYEVSGREIAAVGSFFENMASQNVKQYEGMNTKDMTPEQFQTYRDSYDAAKSGSTQLNNTMKAISKRVSEVRDKQKDDAAGESADVLKRIEPRWNNEFYAKVGDFAVKSGRYSADEFADVTDWRTMEGLVALMDSSEVANVGSGKSGKSEISEPGTRKRRRQRQRQRKNAAGQFQSNRNAVLESKNAKKDGSLRDMFKQKLASERG